MTITKQSFNFLVYLALLSIIGFLATDMYLPAFDAMKNDLNTNKSVIGASLTVFLGGFAVGQLFWGGFADKHGKAKAVLLGLIIFFICSFLITMVKNGSLLLFYRAIQAFGACAAAVSWQAMVIDYYPSERTNKVFASIMPLVALSPALAPIAGAFILETSGWRAIFFVLMAISVLLASYTFILFITERTEHKTLIKNAQQVGVSYFSFFKSQDYVGNVMIYAFCSAAFFAWLTGSPFILKELGCNEQEIGLSFIPQTITFLLGGYGYRLLADKLNNNKLLPVLLILFSLSMLLLLFIVVFTEPTLLTLLIPFSLMAFANGATYPIVVNEALKSFKNHSGKAAALQNFVQLGVCFIASALVSIFASNVLMTTSLVMVGTVIFVATGYLLTRNQGN